MYKRQLLPATMQLRLPGRSSAVPHLIWLPAKNSFASWQTISSNHLIKPRCSSAGLFFVWGKEQYATSLNRDLAKYREVYRTFPDFIDDTASIAYTAVVNPRNCAFVSARERTTTYRYLVANKLYNTNHSVRDVLLHHHTIGSWCYRR